ncbi:GntR family transcriptional regulator [Novipirellula artificiosorum]|uniref:HTH-type transcriptional repressor YtrA n=1 Tax=Novipirellula artificiosorum TaxID=2528016 RepID=A0A5C6DMG8_9BACT|nr:GntR family transcriptional regulator [Novipirellula artificiosorum]TWU37334.1 HTH-type transcriptional repressor YtrA [Novipirellula artificiosorum]
MFFSIDPSGGVAIYEQIVRQVKFAIAEQTLRPGQLLPSVRVLSHQLAINPNTIARAYLQLQADGVLESLRGRGLAVCDGATDQCRSFRLSLMAERIAMVLGEALHGGLTTDEISDIVAEQLKLLSGNVTTISQQPVSDNPSTNSEADK